ncbi:carotenoid cleavage dioxygenase 1 [Coniochaeta sp. 2T2.1]|nr:carotenoid cleavage dioxygenase 1 [Coniochaeta sp. 2T2.1]
MSSAASTDNRANGTYTPLGTTSRYSGAEEAKKHQEQVRAHQQVAEWPNDAGFQGLDEHQGPIELKITGDIPAWAAGTLYRTGPAGCTVEDTSAGTFDISHWFDGLAHTHRFDIIADEDPGDDVTATNGVEDSARPSAPLKVLYSSLRQSDNLVQDIKKHGRVRAICFGQRSDPCVGLYSKFMTAFVKPPKDAPDNISVTVQTKIPGLQKKLGHQGSVFLGTDSAQLLEMDPTTMQPLEQRSHASLHPELKGESGPAHPCVDPTTGEYFSLNIAPGATPKSTYRVFRVDASGKVKILATFTTKAAYIHSFFLSPNYIVLCIPVAHYDGVHIIWKRSIMEAFEPFDETKQCKWMVIDRHHGKGIVAQFRSPASFFFHTTNAFEEEPNGDVICEFVQFRNRAIIDSLYYDVVLNRNNKGADFWTMPKTAEDARPHLVRYRLPKSEFTRKEPWSLVEKELDIPSPSAGEMPIVNPAYKGRKNRYVWSLLNRQMSTLFDAIGKTDTETGEVLFWEGPRGHTPSEAIFVGRPASTADEKVDEDDGVLLSVVLDGHNRKSYLLCLDARTMTEMGRAECEFAVGFGFHGQHLPVEGT